MAPHTAYASSFGECPSGGALPEKHSKSRWRYQYAIEQADRLAASAGGCSITETLSALSSNRAYEPYWRAPFFIMRQIEKAGAPEMTAKMLGACTLFFVWLKSVDEELDHSGKSVGHFFNLLRHPEAATGASTAEKLTSGVGAIVRLNDTGFLKNIYLAGQAVSLEKSCRSMEELVRVRMKGGALTALSMVDFMEWPPGALKKVRRLFCRLGAAGNLADTVIDLKKDCAAGHLNFRPGLGDRLLLYRRFLKNCASILKEYPTLYGEAAPLLFRLLRYRLRG